MSLIANNISLKPYNTFGIEVFAQKFIEFESKNELIDILSNVENKKNLKLIVGGGSNILLTKNIEGLVLKNNIKGIEIIEEDDDYRFIKSGSGEVWHDFVMFCVENNFSGVENLSLIPGTVGAAPMQNIGAYGVEIKDVFHSLDAIEIDSLQLKTFTKDECNFGYRESVFKHQYKDKYIIVSVVFKLPKVPNFNTSYGAIKEILDRKNITELSIKHISDAVIEIRKSKLPDPKILGNSGSFFKNPEIDNEIFEKLKTDYPEIPNYPAPNNKIKLAAGWLIEQCGWKGKIVGNTGSHKDQALVLVNYGNATGSEIWKLALEIQQSVKHKFGIEIHPEVNVI